MEDKEVERPKEDMPSDYLEFHIWLNTRLVGWREGSVA